MLRRRRQGITILFSFLTVFTIIISIDLQLSFVNSAFALDKEFNNSIKKICPSNENFGNLMNESRNILKSCLTQITAFPNSHIPTSFEDEYNTHPFAEIEVRPDDIVKAGVVVTLDGTKSYDLDFDDSIVSYKWEQNEGPLVSLSPNSNSAVVTFTSPTMEDDEGGFLLFSLTVEDEHGGTDTVPTVISVLPGPPDRINIPPVALLTITPPAGLVMSGETVTIDATPSYDPDPDDSIVSYKWKQIGGPTVSFSPDSTSEVITFTAPKVDGIFPETFIIYLTVEDEYGGTDTTGTYVTIFPNTGSK